MNARIPTELHHLSNAHLDALEEETIFILREVAAAFERPTLLFSGGKDSLVMLKCAEKAFGIGRIPYPLLMIDTGHNFPEVTDFRDLRAKELGEIIAKARPSIAWCEASLSAELLLTQEQHPDLLTVLLFNSHSAADSVESLSAEFSTAASACPATGDDIALLAFTSGTTGVPKGTLHFHRDVLAICDVLSRHLIDPQETDVFIGTPPLAFTFGLGGLLLFPMVAGASIFYPAPPLTPERMVLEIAQSQATICYTAPTFYRQMAAHIQQQSVPALRISVSAGEALPDTTVKSMLPSLLPKQEGGVSCRESVVGIRGCESTKELVIAQLLASVMVTE